MMILIPAKNAQNTIRRALLSVANQVDPHWTAQVLVDCSTTDDTYKKVRLVKQELSCGGNIHVNISKRPGLPNVYRELIDRAEPRDGICGFLDADDRLSPGAVKKVRPHYLTDRKLGHLWSQFAHHPSGARGFSTHLPGGKSLLQAFNGGWWGAQHFRTFRKSVYDESPYDLQLDIPYATDFNLALVLAATDCKAKFLPEVLYYYHRTPSGITVSRKGRQTRDCRELRNRFQRWSRGKRCAS